MRKEKHKKDKENVRKKKETIRKLRQTKEERGANLKVA